VPGLVLLGLLVKTAAAGAPRAKPPDGFGSVRLTVSCASPKASSVASTAKFRLVATASKRSVSRALMLSFRSEAVQSEVT
jgi:hypothetical protein